MGIQWRSEPSERIHQRFLDVGEFLINFWLIFINEINSDSGRETTNQKHRR